MNQEFNKFDPEDPRLTDYVLGELDETARMEMEWQLEHCPETRAAIGELQELSQHLQSELQSEPTAGLTDSQRTAITQEAGQQQTVPAESVSVRKPVSRKIVIGISTILTVAVASLLLAVLPPGGSFDDSASRFNSLFGRQVSNETPSTEFSDDLVSLVEESRTGDIDFSDVRIDFDFNTQNPSGSLSKGFSNDRSGPSQSNLHSVVKNHEQLPTVRGSQSNDSKHFTYGIPQLAQTGKQSTGFDANGKVIRPTVVSGGTNLTLSAANGSTTAPGKPNSNTVRLGKGRTPLRFGAVQVPSQQSGASKSDRLLGEKQRLAGPKNSTTYSAVRPAPTQRVYTSTDLKEPAIRTNARQLTEAKSLGRRRGLNGAQVFERAPRSERKLGERSDGYAFDSFATTLQGTEQYEPIIENEFLAPQKAPLSTFGIDVDTAAYSNMRRFLNQGQLPPANAVRIEELINYFSYSDAQPEGEHPFSVNLELGPCAWNPQHQLVRVGLKGKEIAREDRPASNLVFLIDVSGSMKSAKKLPLVKTSLHMLVEQMTDNDRIAIVTYAGNAGLQLPSTAGVQKQIISSAIDRLVAGGSTNGEAGIGLAYQTAVDNLLEEGTNRVILCTDGDFNVGVSGNDDLVRIIQDKAKSGVFLSIFGFGMGNLKDAKLEALADKGNGQYGYIDNRAEARKVFVEEMTGTLHTIAKDVKIQVEFNPAYVGEYRLIGYENRVLAAKDFADDKKDAGDIGAGHSVTALYEIVPAGVTRLANTVEGLKYQKTVSVKEEPVLGDPESNELLTVKLRYKQPDGQKSTKVEFPLKKSAESPKQLSQNFQWSSAVAMFGLLLRDSQHAGAASFDGVLEMATRSQGADLSGYRSEFLDLVRKARSLKPVRR